MKKILNYFKGFFKKKPKLKDRLELLKQHGTLITVGASNNPKFDVCVELSKSPLLLIKTNNKDTKDEFHTLYFSIDATPALSILVYVILSAGGDVPISVGENFLAADGDVNKILIGDDALALFLALRKTPFRRDSIEESKSPKVFN